MLKSCSGAASALAALQFGLRHLEQVERPDPSPTQAGRGRKKIPQILWDGVLNYHVTVKIAIIRSLTSCTCLVASCSVTSANFYITTPNSSTTGLPSATLTTTAAFEVIVAGFGFPNLVLKWDGSSFRNVASFALADPQRQAIGIAACDIDGDGQEEIYILNTDTFAGQNASLTVCSIAWTVNGPICFR